MDSSGNPYRPPAEIDDAPVPIEFSGQVTREDVAALLPNAQMTFFLWGLAYLSLTSMAAAFVYLVSLNPSSANSVSFLIGMTIVALALAATVGANWFFSRKQKVRRLIARNPKLIGPLRGKLDEYGFMFFNVEDEQFQQCSWTAFSAATVTRGGVRLDWAEHRLGFVPIPASSILGFDRPVIHETIERMRSGFYGPAVFRVVPDWTDMPPSTIAFAGLATPKATHSLATVLAWSLTVIDAIAWLAVFATIFLDYAGMTFTILFLVAACTSGLSRLVWSRIAPPGCAEEQWGWATEDGATVHLPGRVRDLRWADAIEVNIHQSDLQVQFPDDSPLTIAQSDLVDGGWLQLVQWISENQNAPTKTV